MSSFFFNDTATTEIYTLSLHDALPIFAQLVEGGLEREGGQGGGLVVVRALRGLEARNGQRDEHAEEGQEECDPGHRSLRSDRKSTRLNSSHANISYAVFCLKKKKKMST